MSKIYKPDIVAILEPKVSGAKADYFIKGSGFEFSHRVEAEGFAGGIWILWNRGFAMEFVVNHKQYIHFKVTDFSGNWSWVTAVYASPNPSLQRKFWNELESIAKSIEGPWMLGGDFNSILHASEKKGGSPKSSGICRSFNNWFHDNRLIDLHFKGPCFTWSRGTLFKRLDRAICNDHWNSLFTEASVLHLPKIHSDHHPILVSFESNLNRRNSVKPFHFLTAWLMDHSFISLVAKEWRDSEGYFQAAHVFVDKVSKWNRDNFGNIFKRKRRILARLNGIQRAMECFDSKGLLKLESKLKTELENILSQEEVL